MNKKLILISLTVILSLSFIGAGCKKEQPLQGNLLFWGVFDDSDAFEPLIKDFKALHPKVTIEYRKKTIDTYESELINALAEGRGPDIFMIHHTWLSKHLAKISPVPPEIITFGEYQNTFADVAVFDLVLQDGIYSLPLYVDTLALFYNKDFFNNAVITKPPATWEEFQDAVKKLRKKDDFGNLTEAGAAIGTALNINRASDILATLMLQQGSTITGEDGSAAFNNKEGFEALRFYTDFSNREKDVYTWNPTQHYSSDAFFERKAAMMFNYAYKAAELKAKDPRFNFKVASFPQIKTDAKVNYANYWTPTVSAASSQKDLAWTFLKFISEKEEAQKYLAVTKRPAARLDILEEQKDDLEIGVFAEQVLTAQSWNRIDSTKIDDVFTEMIENVVTGKSSISRALTDAEEKVNLLVQK